MKLEKINTIPIENIISMIKTAEARNDKEIRIPLKELKNLSHSLTLLLLYLNNDLITALQQNVTKSIDESIEINLDGGKSW